MFIPHITYGRVKRDCKVNQYKENDEKSFGSDVWEKHKLQSFLSENTIVNKNHNIRPPLTEKKIIAN